MNRIKLKIDLFSEYRGKAPFVGIFTYRMPELLILEPSLVNEIFVGKFKNFHLNYTNVSWPTEETKWNSI